MQAESYIRSAVLYADRSDVVEITRDEAVLQGAMAFRLAVTLRKEHGYPSLRVPNPFGDDLIGKIPEIVKRWKAEGAPPIIDS